VVKGATTVRIVCPVRLKSAGVKVYAICRRVRKVRELPQRGRYNPMIRGSGKGKRKISWRAGQGLTK